MQSQFGPSEALSILVAWTVLSFGITYRYFVELLNGVTGGAEYVLAGFIATATGFILHEMGHKYVALSRGYVAHFRVWLWGLAITLITVVLSGGGFVFGAPGAVYIAPAPFEYYSGAVSRDVQEENMIISAAGPAVNLAFALSFLALLLTSSGFLSVVGLFGFSLNVGLGSFNMIPIPPLDGSKIFKKNVLVGLALALPLWIMFLIFY